MRSKPWSAAVAALMMVAGSVLAASAISVPASAAPRTVASRAVPRTVKTAADAMPAVVGGAAGLFGNGFPVGQFGQVAARILDKSVATHSVTRVDVGRTVSQLPAVDQSAVVLTITVASVTEAGGITAYPGGTARPDTTNVSFAPGLATAVQVIVGVGAQRAVNLYNSAAAGVRLVVDFAGYYRGGTYAHAATLHPLTPARVVDTRRSLGATHFLPHEVQSVDVAGHGAVPGAGVGSVVVSLTVTAPTATGYVRVGNAENGGGYGTSSLNFTAGQTVTNTVVAPIDSFGQIDIEDHSDGTLEVVVDVMAYISSGSATVEGAYQPVRPVRALDTRYSDGGVTPGPHGVVKVKLEGVHGLPTSHALAFLVNLVVTAPSAPGYVTAYTSRSDAGRPTTSSLNFARGQTVTNLIVAQPSADGTISVYNGALGSTPLVADVVGYYYTGTAAPTQLSGRVVDARTGAPVAGLTVGNFFVVPDEDESPIEDSTTTAADGTWTLTAAGYRYDYVVYVFDRRSTPTYVDQVYGAPAGATSPASYVQAVTATTTAEITFAVAVGAAVSGTVTDQASGRTVQSEIYTFDTAGHQIDYSYTDANGRYALTLAVPTAGVVICFKPADSPQPATGWVARCNQGTPWFHGEELYGSTAPATGSVPPLHPPTGQMTTVNVAYATGGAVTGSWSGGRGPYNYVGVVDAHGTLVQWADVSYVKDSVGSSAFKLFGLAPGRYTLCYLAYSATPSQCYRGAPWTALPGAPPVTAAVPAGVTEVTVNTGKTTSGIDPS